MHDFIVVAQKKEGWKSGERDTEVSIRCRTCVINTGKVSSYLTLAQRDIFTPAEIAAVMRIHQAGVDNDLSSSD